MMRSFHAWILLTKLFRMPHTRMQPHPPTFGQGPFFHFPGRQIRGSNNDVENASFPLQLLYACVGNCPKMYTK